nr:MAG TPA: hypothetical protein [Bacteriophage sp.]
MFLLILSFRICLNNNTTLNIGSIYLVEDWKK